MTTLCVIKRKMAFHICFFVAKSPLLAFVGTDKLYTQNFATTSHLNQELTWRSK